MFIIFINMKFIITEPEKFVAYNGSMQTPNDLADLKDEISKFCNV